MSILEQGGCIDSFGVGERLITAKSDPVFGAVYKIAAVEENGVFQPRIKISENVEKITNPGLKKVYRIYDENKKAIADLIAGADEVVDLSKPYRYVDPVKPWKNRYFENCTAVELQQLVVKNGKRVMDRVSIDEIKKYVQDQLTDNIWEEEQRFENPHNHYLDMSPAYYGRGQGVYMLHRKTRSRSWKGVAVLGALPHFVRCVCQVPTPFQRSYATAYAHPAPSCCHFPCPPWAEAGLLGAFTQ